MDVFALRAQYFSDGCLAEGQKKQTGLVKMQFFGVYNRDTQWDAILSGIFSQPVGDNAATGARAENEYLRHEPREKGEQYRQ
jgi:hypothetical protein